MRYPSRSKITTWDAQGSFTIDSDGFLSLIRRLISSFHDLGISRGNKACIICNTGETHLLAAEFALMQLGCIVVPVHDALPERDRQVIYSEVLPACTIAKTAEEAGRLTAFANTGRIVTLDTLHTPPFESETLHTSCAPEDLALIIYTSGSSGKPKGVMLSHHSVISTVLSALAIMPIRYGHTVMSYLPVAHILERVAVYCYLTAGVHLHLVESTRQGMALLKKVRPQYLTAVPRILDRAVTKFQQAGETRHYFLRSILLWAMETESPKPQTFRGIVRKIILRRLSRSFGGRVRGILAGGAALNPATERLFRAAGMQVRQGYGLTECCGIVTCNRFEPGGNMPGSVGLPAPGVEIRIDKDPTMETGEILVRSNGLMAGYYLREQETAAAMTPDGWLKTGDSGLLVNEKFLKITGRVKDHFKNAYGEYVAPVKIEQLLEEDPWISRALVIGAGRASTGALIVPEFETLEIWCQSHRVHWTSPLYMVHNTEVLHQFEQRILNINKSLPIHEQVRKFKLLHEPWKVEDGTLTASMKIRREEIETRYKKLLDEMYKE